MKLLKGYTANKRLVEIIQKMEKDNFNDTKRQLLKAEKIQLRHVQED